MGAVVHSAVRELPRKEYNRNGASLSVGPNLGMISRPSPVVGIAGKTFVAFGRSSGDKAEHIASFGYLSSARSERQLVTTSSLTGADNRPTRISSACAASIVDGDKIELFQSCEIKDDKPSAALKRMQLDLRLGKLLAVGRGKSGELLILAACPEEPTRKKIISYSFSPTGSKQTTIADFVKWKHERQPTSLFYIPNVPRQNAHTNGSIAIADDVGSVQVLERNFPGKGLQAVQYDICSREDNLGPCVGIAKPWGSDRPGILIARGWEVRLYEGGQCLRSFNCPSRIALLTSVDHRERPVACLQDGSVGEISATGFISLAKFSGRVHAVNCDQKNGKLRCVAVVGNGNFGEGLRIEELRI